MTIKNLKKKKQTHDKQDVFNALECYIKVLEQDVQHHENQDINIVLKNVICSLNEIIQKLKD